MLQYDGKRAARSSRALSGRFIATLASILLSTASVAAQPLDTVRVRVHNHDMTLYVSRSSGPVVVLHTQPKDGQYQSVVQVPYGEKLTLPPPFDVDLDTSEFPVDPS